MFKVQVLYKPEYETQYLYPKKKNMIQEVDFERIDVKQFQVI